MQPVPLAGLPKPRYLFLAGAFGVGKDYVARTYMPNALVIKVAAPLYGLAEVLTGRRPDKTQPGGRELLQRLGAWGRGDVNVAHPWSAERAAALHYIRRHVLGDDEFGSPGYWSSAFRKALFAAAEAEPQCDFVCTDVRFWQEIRVAREFGPVMLVMAMPETLRARREAAGYVAKAGDAATDPSEALAVGAWEALENGRLPAYLFDRAIDCVVWNDPAPAHPGLVESALAVYTV